MVRKHRQTAIVAYSLISLALRGERTITFIPRSHAHIHGTFKVKSNRQYTLKSLRFSALHCKASWKYIGVH